jgi:hypothetical protein
MLVNHAKGKVQTHFIAGVTCAVTSAPRARDPLETGNITLLSPCLRCCFEFFKSPLRGFRGTREGNGADQHS